MQSERNDSMFTCSSVRCILFLVIMMPNIPRLMMWPGYTNTSWLAWPAEDRCSCSCSTTSKGHLVRKEASPSDVSQFHSSDLSWRHFHPNSHCHRDSRETCLSSEMEQPRLPPWLSPRLTCCNNVLHLSLPKPATCQFFFLEEIQCCWETPSC